MEESIITKIGEVEIIRSIKKHDLIYSVEYNLRQHDIYKDELPYLIDTTKWFLPTDNRCEYTYEIEIQCV